MSRDFVFLGIPRNTKRIPVAWLLLLGGLLFRSDIRPATGSKAGQNICGNVLLVVVKGQRCLSHDFEKPKTLGGCFMYREILLKRLDGDVHFKLANEEDRKILGNRSKIGGMPDWMQGEEIPHCSFCAQEMVFYGQLDSIGDEFSIGDAGMIYVFICPKCLESKSIVQTY